MLTVSLLVCAMIALARADDAAPACPDQWSIFNNRCFRYIETERSWSDAEKNCQTMKGNLASVNTEDDFAFLEGMVTEINSTIPETWVGGSNCQQDKTWLWSDGNVFFFSHWCDEKPDNEGGDQHCMVMNSTAGNCWNDMDCSNKFPSLCVLNL